MSEGTGSRAAQRRPEHKLRRHAPPLSVHFPMFSSSLNEGRSISSGDTLKASKVFPSATISAQRRPEHKLRRHPAEQQAKKAPPAPPLNEGRSISSGDTPQRNSHLLCRRGPLNEGRSISSGDTTCADASAPFRSCAQRRPEHKLRRHIVLPVPVVEVWDLRSTKAGA